MGQRPKSRSAEREIFSAFLLVLFFAPAVSKKRTERIRMRYIEKILSVLFGQRAAKRTKNGVKEVSPLRRRRGLLTLDLGRFLKKATQKLFICDNPC